jgi:signal transduction histidine kinase
VGWAENVAAATDREGVAADAARIEREAEDLAELGERARHIDATLEASGPRETVALAAVLDPVVADVRDAWPSASVDLDVDDLAVVVEDRERLALAVRNLVENAVEHGADGDGRVSVTARRADDEVVLVVADDGPGLPPVERETLRRGSESPLTHSAGLGLWLARWLLEAVGGSVTVASGDGGTTVTVRLPAATSE